MSALILSLLFLVVSLTASCSDNNAPCSNESTGCHQAPKSVKNLRHDFCERFSGQCVQPYDCSDWYKAGYNVSGVYTIQPRQEAFQVYCDMQTAGGGWTVFQRRMDGSVDFDETWAGYKDGFGNLWGEHWLGNEKMSVLTSGPETTKYKFRADLMTFDDETAFAEYDDFRIGAEGSGYKLYIGQFHGTTGDGNTIGLNVHRGLQFSTKDKGPSAARCSKPLGNAGWWFGGCHNIHLNGPYFHEANVTANQARGLHWGAWKGHKESLRAASLKFRKTNF